MTAAITPAAFAGIQLPPTAFGFRASFLPCLPVDADTSGPAPIIEPMPSAVGETRSAFRALILTALRDRRAVLIHRVEEAKASRQHKRRSICEAELRGLTTAIMALEMGR